MDRQRRENIGIQVRSILTRNDIILTVEICKGTAKARVAGVNEVIGGYH